MLAALALGTPILRRCDASMPIPSGRRVLSWLTQYWTVAVAAGKGNAVRA